MLEQRITTLPQQRETNKLLGFDHRVEYSSGKSNMVTDTLSRRDEPYSGSIYALSIPQMAWLAEIRAELLSRPELQSLIENVKVGEALDPLGLRR